MSPRTAKNDAIEQKNKGEEAKKGLAGGTLVTYKKTPKKTPPTKVTPQKAPPPAKKSTPPAKRVTPKKAPPPAKKATTPAKRVTTKKAPPPVKKATTPAKRKKDQNNIEETPEKSSTSTPNSRNVYTLIITNNGRKVQFENKTSLKTFLEDYSSTVRFQETFKTKKSMTEYIDKQEEKDDKMRETERKPIPRSNVGSLAVVSDTDQAAAQRIIDRMRSRSPAERILIDAHTNDSSDCCVATIREVDIKGKMKWWTKGDMTAPVVANFIEDQPVHDKTIQEALANMEFADKRKNGGGPDEKEEESGRMKIKDENKKDKWVDNGQSYPVTISFTHFGFDHTNFLNKEEETLWLEETLHKFGKEFIRVRMNRVFLLLLEEQCTPKQWSTMMNGKTYGYTDFYSKCGVVVNFTNNLNELVTKNSKNQMDDYLLEKVPPNYALKYKKTRKITPIEPDEESTNSE